MFSRFHDRFGTAGLVIAVIALIAALAGTAIAARGLTAKQKKEVTKIAQKYAGKQGPPGATGPQGPPGANGTNGEKGAQGIQGIQGEPGENVEVKTYTGSQCSGEGEEGAELTNGTGTAYACNGKEGSPWTAGGTLPSGKTETGAWGGRVPGAALISSTISFPIPLAAEIDFTHVVLVFKVGSVSSNCDDGVAPAASVSHPEADRGFLCIFEGPSGEIAAERKLTSNDMGANTVGAVVVAETDGFSQVFGTWAVTAP